MIKKFEFVFLKPYECTGDIGIVVDLNKEGSKAKVATLDISSDFAVKEVEIDDLMSLPKIVIESVLGDVSSNQKHYAYFIIMLNGLGNLNKYTIVEGKEIQEVRGLLEKNNSYIPCSTTKDIQYLLMKLHGCMQDKGIDAWRDDKFVDIANKYAITEENLYRSFFNT